jgi:hypothetical protein
VNREGGEGKDDLAEEHAFGTKEGGEDSKQNEILFESSYGYAALLLLPLALLLLMLLLLSLPILWKLLHLI